MNTPALYSQSITPQNDIAESLSSLALNYGNLTLYSAGLPNFPANFSRDGILAAILFGDSRMLRDQLIFCSLLQGTEKDPYTAEEPGKIFHEMPPARIRGMSTEFNTCDATALYLYGHEAYLALTQDDDFIKRQRVYLEKAVEYILSHLVNNLFAEDPKYCGAKRFALRVTYWKDSQVPNRDHGIPLYPAVFTLAHVQNMRALKSAALLLDAPDLLQKARVMNKYLSILFNEERGIYHIGIDQKGFIPGISSDTLHILYYLEPDEIAEEKVRAISEHTKSLETTYGYLTLNTADVWLTGDKTVHHSYHTNTIWPFEQAYIHMAAQKFGLSHVVKVAERIIPLLDTFPELFVVHENTTQKAGSTTQLWTIAAKKYFSSVERSL